VLSLKQGQAVRTNSLKSLKQHGMSSRRTSLKHYVGCSSNVAYISSQALVGCSSIVKWWMSLLELVGLATKLKLGPSSDKKIVTQALATKLKLGPSSDKIVSARTLRGCCFQVAFGSSLKRNG